MPEYCYTFKTPDYIEQEIVDRTGSKIGTIRLRPSGVMWKPVKAHKFNSVTLQEFTEWIMANPKAKITARQMPNWNLKHAYAEHYSSQPTYSLAC